jgi:hypothetical protein
MNVGELINKLEKLDPNIEIMVESHDNNMDGYYNIEHDIKMVNYNDNDRVILSLDYNRKKRRI